MASGLIAGIMGGIAGAGKAMQDNAMSSIEQKRQEALRRLDHDLAMERQSDQQAFATSEREAGQEYQTGRDETLHGYNLEELGQRHQYDMERERYSQSQQNARHSSSLAASREQGRNDWQLVQLEGGGYAQWSPSRNAYRDANLPDGAMMGAGEMTSRQKVQLEELQSQRKLIADRLNGDVPPDPDTEADLNAQLDTLNARIGRLITPNVGSEDVGLELDAGLESLGGTDDSGVGGNGGGDPDNSYSGIIAREQKSREEARAEREKKSEVAKAQNAAKTARQDADRLLEKLDGSMRSYNPYGFGGTSLSRLNEADREAAIAEAQQVAEQIKAFENNPHLTPDEQRWMAERLRRLQEAGVPINLN